MSLSKSDQNDLWNGLIQNDFTKFTNISNPFLSSTYKQIPFRIYSSTSPMIIQEPVSGENTLGEVLDKLVGEKEGECWIHGIVPELDIGFDWLSRNLAYPDGFLHLVWKEKDSLKIY